ncbi:hypothetical protein MD484_g3054, partial [Candolleomyces efflorescens]
MAGPSLPLAMFQLFSISPDPTVMTKVSLPPRETELDPQIRKVAKILDAIVHFLPTTKGPVFALSLEVNETNVRMTVAGDTQEHFRKAFNQTPAQFIQSIWTGMHSIATSQGPPAKDLIASLFQRHEVKLMQRFEKRKDQCREFFRVAKEPDFWSTLSAHQRRLVVAAEDIFEYTSTFFNFPQEKRRKMYPRIYSRLQEASVRYKASKKDPMENMEWVRALESTVQDNPSKFSIAVLGSLTSIPFSANPSKPFDLIRYIDKLLSPSIHAARLCRTGKDPFFQSIMHLPLNVDFVSTTPPPSTPLNKPSNQEVRSFLDDCYGEYALEEQEIVSAVLDLKLAEILTELDRRHTLQLLPPHCECSLINHHHSHHDSSPYPYIAVSKLSCLQCALYAAACRKYGRKVGKESESKNGEGLIPFQTQGCRTDAIPLVSLPTGATPELGAFVEEDILSAVKEIVRVCLRDAVQGEKKRRLSQSTAGSIGSSSDFFTFSSDSEDEADFPRRVRGEDV